MGIFVFFFENYLKIILRTCTYLPVDKQFLITKQVPCHQRCAQIMGYDESKEKVFFNFKCKKF